MRRTLLCLLWILLAPTTTLGQDARTIGANESFRAEPDGAILGTLDESVTLQIGNEREGWLEAILEGWIWAPSVRADSRPGFDLVLGAKNGENLRATPNGDRIARLSEGTLLVELEREGRWVRVRRSGWVRRAAIDPGADEEADRETLASGEIAWTERAGARLLNAREGDTLAVIRPMAAVEVIEVDSMWARVRIEGWVRKTTIASAIDSASVITGLAPEVLRSSPDRFRGRIIEWEIQFITLDRAEKIRTDFKEDELFILARPPGDQPGFVYIAVPEDLAKEVEALTPLQRVNLLARIRTGRSEQMAAPILELLEIR